MKKKINIFFAVLLYILAFPQVGINTSNPQGVFNIDAAKDNNTTGTPTVAQQANDFVITQSGDVGIGNTAPQAKLDVNTTNSGILFPRLSNTQRDAIPVGRAQAGTVIFNTNASKLQVNIGTDASRVWVNLDTSSTTINTTAVFRGDVNTPQTVGLTNVPINLPFTDFNNIPAGFVAKQANNQTIRLSGGKTYKLDLNAGRINSSDSNHTWCQIYNITTALPLSSVSILPNSMTTTNWNTFNTTQAFITVPIGSTQDINVRCAKTTTGIVTIPDGIPPLFTITIMN